MSAVSIKVMPESSAAWMVAMAWDSSGYFLSLFIDIGMAPRPIAETRKGPSCRVCMGQRLSSGHEESRPRPDDRRRLPPGAEDDHQLGRQVGGHDQGSGAGAGRWV